MPAIIEFSLNSQCARDCVAHLLSYWWHGPSEDGVLVAHAQGLSLGHVFITRTTLTFSPCRSRPVSGACVLPYACKPLLFVGQLAVQLWKKCISQLLHENQSLNPIAKAFCRVVLEVCLHANTSDQQSLKYLSFFLLCFTCFPNGWIKGFHGSSCMLTKFMPNGEC